MLILKQLLCDLKLVQQSLLTLLKRMVALSAYLSVLVPFIILVFYSKLDMTTMYCQLMTLQSTIKSPFLSCFLHFKDVVGCKRQISSSGHVQYKAFQV